MRSRDSLIPATRTSKVRRRTDSSRRTVGELRKIARKYLCNDSDSDSQAQADAYTTSTPKARAETHATLKGRARHSVRAVEAGSGAQRTARPILRRYGGLFDPGD